LFFQVILIIMSSLLILLVAGVTTLTGIFMVSVTVRNPTLDLEKYQASNFNSSIWAIFAAARGIAWLVSLLIRPLFILAVAWVLLLTGTLSLQLFKVYEGFLTQANKILAFKVSEGS
jgi:hypothetical protein